MHRVQRISIVALAVSATFVGLWAAIAPSSWFVDFPLPGRHWVSAMGAYDEHLVRDVGSLYLALLVLSVFAYRRNTTDLTRITGCVWLVFSVPHLAFHLQHLGHFPLVDAVGQAATLGGTCVLAGLLLVPAHGQVCEPRSSNVSTG